MSVEIFSRVDFEAALPEGYWEHAGFMDGEHCYLIPIVKDEVGIIIRSSIKQNGYSADTGEDSIRAWLVNGEGKPLGSKVSKYTTRVPGWDERLLDVLRELWNRAKQAGYCQKCNHVKGVYKVKKPGPNKGRLFAKCQICENDFSWLS